MQSQSKSQHIILEILTDWLQSLHGKWMTQTSQCDTERDQRSWKWNLFFHRQSLFSWETSVLLLEPFNWLDEAHPDDQRLSPFSSAQFSPVAQLCPTLCDPMNLSTPGLPVHHHLLEFTQTHVHPVRDAIQPSHPLSSPSPPALNLSQHQSLFQWVNSSHEVAKVLEFQL